MIWPQPIEDENLPLLNLLEKYFLSPCYPDGRSGAGVHVEKGYEGCRQSAGGITVSLLPCSLGLCYETDATKRNIRVETDKKLLLLDPLCSAVFKEFLHHGTKAEFSIPFHFFFKPLQGLCIVIKLKWFVSYCTSSNVSNTVLVCVFLVIIKRENISVI